MVIQRHPRGPEPLDETDPTIDLLAVVAAHRPAWMRSALCADHLEINFFPERGQSLAPALAICGRCPVLIACREWSIADSTLDFGVLGGMSAPARKAARRLTTKRNT